MGQWPLRSSLALRGRSCHQSKSDCIERSCRFQNNADIRALDEQGRSGLWHARNSGFKECADMLLTAGLETNYGMPAQSMRSSASSPPLPDVSPIQISNSGRLLCQLPERLQDDVGFRKRATRLVKVFAKCIGGTDQLLRRSE